VKVVITGIAGKLGRHLAQQLAFQGHRIWGIDRRPWPDPPAGVQVLQEDIRKRPAEDLVRTLRPEAVIHLATVTHFSSRSAQERYRTNLGGTRALFDYCHKYGVDRVVFVGRHTYYGAAADAPLYHHELDPPLAVSTFPELADLVAADLYAGTALWRSPQMATAVLRFVYTLGPAHHGTLATFLRGPRVPRVLGFDPLFQFMHDSDVVDALALALDKRIRGIFNVAGPPPVPLSVLIRETGRRAVALPRPILTSALGRLGLPYLSPAAVAHLQYPVVVDDSAFRQATGFNHRFDETQTMAAYRWA
jgi:UDP-glucose 4-epimerase